MKWRGSFRPVSWFAIRTERRSSRQDPDTPQSSVPGVGAGAGNDLFSRETMSLSIAQDDRQGCASGSEQLKQTIEVAKMLQPPPAPALSVEQIVERCTSALNARRRAGTATGIFSRTLSAGICSSTSSRPEVAPAAAVEGAPSWVQRMKGIVSELVDCHQFSRAFSNRTNAETTDALPQTSERTTAGCSYRTAFSLVVQLAFEKMGPGHEQATITPRGCTASIRAA